MTPKRYTRGINLGTGGTMNQKELVEALAADNEPKGDADIAAELLRATRLSLLVTELSPDCPRKDGCSLQRKSGENRYLISLWVDRQGCRPVSKKCCDANDGLAFHPPMIEYSNLVQPENCSWCDNSHEHWDALAVPANARPCRR